MRFPFFRNRDSVKNGILISIRRTGDGFHPGLFSFYNTVNDCGRFGSMNRINQSSANSSFYVLKNITGKTGSASPNGATANATVYTMVEMAKTNALNTYKYLTYLLSQRPNDKMSNEQLEQLAPWSDTAKVNYQN